MVNKIIFDKNNPITIQFLMNLPHGEFRRTLDQAVNLGNMQAEVAQATKKYWQVMRIKQQLLVKIKRYLHRCLAQSKNVCFVGFFSAAPLNTATNLIKLKASMACLAKKLVMMFEQLKDLQMRILHSEQHLEQLNFRLTADLYQYRQETTEAIKDIFAINEIQSFGLFLAVTATELNENLAPVIVERMIENYQPNNNISELQVIRLLNVIFELQKYPKTLQSLGLPGLSANDAESIASILLEFEQHQLCHRLMSCFVRYDEKCRARHLDYMANSVQYTQTIEQLKQTLENSVSSIAELELKLTNYEAEFVRLKGSLQDQLVDCDLENHRQSAWATKIC